MSDSEKNKWPNLEDILQPLEGSNCSDYAVAHATVNVTPFRTFAEVSLLPDILQRMRELGLNRLQRLQSYAWPHLLNGPGHGALIVSAPRSGRTMGYVPPICHVASTILAANRHRREMAVDLFDISHGMGPIALILVPDLPRMEQVAALCSALMPREETVEDMWTVQVTKVLTVPSECTPSFMGAWISEIGVLVATPARFVNACKQGEGLLKLNQLQAVVFDDADLMQQEELELAEQYIPSMAAKHGRPTRKGTHHYPRPQVVTVCQHFTPSLISQLRRFNQHPCLIFGDLLEAALYGGMRLLVNMVGAKDRVAAIVQLLRQRPPAEYRTIIFCDADMQMALLLADLADFEYQCLAYYQTMDLEQLDKVSSWTCDSRGVILVCTDDCPELRVRNAHTIIHYSMSSSWGKFKRRFLFLSDNVPNALISKAAARQPTATNSDQRILDSLVLLDEANARQLPRLVDLMLLRQKLDPNIVAMAARIRKEMNTRKSIVKPLCREILGHGDCRNTRCVDRHYLHEADRHSSAMPCSGDIKVNVLHVYSPGHYCVIVYEHMPPEGKWRDLDPDRNLPALLNLHLTGENVEPPPRYWPPQHQAVCLWKAEPATVAGYSYERVRVLSVPPIENVNVVQSHLMVVVQAMDCSTRRFATECMSLHVCPDEYVAEPPLCMDLRLLGLVNHMGERIWAAKDAETVQDWLDTAPKEHFVQAKVAFSTSHTIFATCMVSMLYLKTVKTFNMHLNLLRAQIEAKMSKRCARTKENILKFFEEHIKLDAPLPKHPKDPPELEYEKDPCEPVRVAKNEHKEQIAESEDRDQSPQSKQDTHKLPARVQRVLDQRLKMLLERENETKTTNAQLEAEQSQSSVMPGESESESESDSAVSKVIPMADFIACFMRCAALDRSEEMETDTAVNSKATAHQISEEAPVQRSKESMQEEPKQTNLEKSHKSKGETLSACAGASSSNAARVVRRASRPLVKYFQTLDALHLQVTMVDERMSYRTRVIRGTSVFFQATPTGASSSCTTEGSTFEFFVNTGIVFKGIQHAMKGRTVYIDLQKANRGFYPTLFVHVKYFQTNYDKTVIEEKWHQRDMKKTNQLMRAHGWGAHKFTAKAESSEETVSETESEDGVERPDYYRRIDMN
ncbi:putative ATP-dependent RNA helicase BoYb [Drosophila obscura]|uniref:putative ATP-dependent RNA helicase BoYb n=1 Tax=Drosophila obscura TaxID=7282 RepID=UPI001BB2049C|nr:putative ATP-dependent RNA helicase BoYb [Drosophila obscura]